MTTTLFALALSVDTVLMLFFGYEGFMVSSNKKRMYRRRFALVFALIVSSIVLSFSHPKQALWLAGVPAAAIALFVLAFVIAMMTHKGPWN